MTTENTNPSAPSLFQFTIDEGERAYQRCKGSIDAIPDDELIPIRADIPQTAMYAVAVSPAVEPLIPQLERLPDFDINCALQIVDRGYAAWYAHVSYLVSAPGNDDLAKAVATCTVDRNQLRSTGLNLAQFGLLAEEAVTGAHTGTSQLDLANECGGLVSLFSRRWAAIRGVIPITEERLHQMSMNASTLLGLVAGHTIAVVPSTSEAAKLRQKAFTFYAHSYDQLRRAVSYVRWDQGDVDRIIPSLYSRDTSASSSSSSAKKSDTAPTAPTSPAAPGTPSKAKDEVTVATVPVSPGPDGKPAPATVQMLPAVPPAKGGGPFIS